MVVGGSAGWEAGRGVCLLITALKAGQVVVCLFVCVCVFGWWGWGVACATVSARGGEKVRSGYWSGHVALLPLGARIPPPHPPHPPKKRCLVS